MFSRTLGNYKYAGKPLTCILQLPMATNASSTSRPNATKKLGTADVKCETVSVSVCVCVCLFVCWLVGWLVCLFVCFVCVCGARWCTYACVGMCLHCICIAGYMFTQALVVLLSLWLRKCMSVTTSCQDSAMQHVASHFRSAPQSQKKHGCLQRIWCHCWV